jgi:uncharacterized protein YcbK (DUF882 family)
MECCLFSINQPRRDFLKLVFGLSLLSALPRSASATENLNNLSLYVKRGSNLWNIEFIKNGTLYEEGYLALCSIFKDTHADVAVKMDPNLFIVLARAQNWLFAYGYREPFILTSGYRTLHTNMQTEGSSANSMHIYGRAADLKYNGIPSSYLAKLFRSFGASGIGIYPTFVHVDTWKERVWRG